MHPKGFAIKLSGGYQRGGNGGPRYGRCVPSWTSLSSWLADRGGSCAAFSLVYNTREKAAPFPLYII